MALSLCVTMSGYDSGLWPGPDHVCPSVTALSISVLYALLALVRAVSLLSCLYPQLWSVVSVRNCLLAAPVSASASITWLGKDCPIQVLSLYTPRFVPMTRLCLLSVHLPGSDVRSPAWLPLAVL